MDKGRKKKTFWTARKAHIKIYGQERARLNKILKMQHDERESGKK